MGRRVGALLALPFLPARGYLRSSDPPAANIPVAGKMQSLLAAERDSRAKTDPNNPELEQEIKGDEQQQGVVASGAPDQISKELLENEEKILMQTMEHAKYYNETIAALEETKAAQKALVEAVKEFTMSLGSVVDMQRSEIRTLRESPETSSNATQALDGAERLLDIFDYLKNESKKTEKVAFSVAYDPEHTDEFKAVKILIDGFEDDFNGQALHNVQSAVSVGADGTVTPENQTAF